MILGGNWGFEEKEVSVAGHTVKRTPVCNAAWQIGLFNEGRAGTGQSNLVSESMMERFQTTSPVLPEIWYNTKTYNDGQRPASEQLGDIRNISSGSDAALQSALAQRTTHIIFTPNNTHARDYFGRDAVQHIVKYFEQVLCYNRGDLTDPATVPLDSSRLEFLMGKHLNLVALLSMCFGMLALSGILMRHKFFAVCKKEVCEPIASKKSVVFCAGRVLRGGYLSYRRLRHEERPRPGLQNGVGQEILVHGLYRQYPYHLYVDPGRLRTGAGLHLLRLQLQKAWPQCP